MVRRSALYFVTLVLLLTSCGQPNGTPSTGSSSRNAPVGNSLTWQEQYDLGLRYLSEGNYQEAILAFTAAIEIDSKQAAVYVSRGDAYVLSGETEENIAAAQVDYKKAIELDETSIEAYLGLADAYILFEQYNEALEIINQAIGAVGEEGRLVDLQKQILAKSMPSAESPTQILDKKDSMVRKDYFNPDGSLNYYTLSQRDETGEVVRLEKYRGDGTYTGYTSYYKSDDGLKHYSEGFSAEGKSLTKSVRVMDENGKWLYSASLNDDGTEKSRSVPQYDDSGKSIGWNNYRNDILTGYVRYEEGMNVYYDANGNRVQYMERK